MLSPLLRRPSPSAVSVAFSSTGSILCSTSVSVWNNVFTSSCTDDAATVAPSRSDEPDGVAGGWNSTDFAPNTVLPAMRTSAFDGMYGMCRRSMDSVSRA